MGVIATVAALLVVPAVALAESSYPLERAPIDPRDLVSLQAGARTFVNYCLNCHGAQYMRYNRLADLGLTEAQIKDNLILTEAKIGDTVTMFGFQARDGSPFAHLREVTGTDVCAVVKADGYGEAGNDTLTVNFAGTNTYCPGVNTQAGSFSVGTSLPISFTDLGAAATIYASSTAVGDTLVVESQRFNGYTRLDTIGHPHSDQLRVTQTFKRVAGDRIAHTITVNDPLVYKGIWFYQSSYGDAWDQIEVARLNIKDKETDKVLKTIDLEGQKEQTLSDLNLKLAITDFVADFAFNSTEKKVYSKTIEHANPAIKLAVNERSTVQATPWIFYQFPDLFEIKDSKYQFELIGYKPKKYTGLQIAKNPGINIVWIGSTMIVVGITLSSFIYHRRLWTKIIPSGNGVTVHVGGTTHKSQIDFQKEFRKLTEKIRTFSA